MLVGQQRAGVPGRHRRRRQPGAQAADRARPAGGRHRRRSTAPQVVDADAAGGAALSHGHRRRRPRRSAGRAGGRRRGPGSPALLVLAGIGGRAADAAPARLRRRTSTVQTRLGRGSAAGLPAAHRRAALEHRPADRRLRARCSLCSASARPGWSSAPTCPAVALWTVLLVAPLAVPVVRQQLRLGLASTPRLEGYAGAVLIVTLSYFPLVYLPAAAALRGLDPGAGGDRRARSGSGRGATSSGCVLPQLRPGAARRRAAGRAAPAGGVRRAAAAALPDVHHRDLRPVPVHRSTARPRPCWPACWSLLCLVPAAGRARPARAARRYARVGGGARPAGRPGARSAPALLAGAGRAGGAGRARARRPARQPGALAGRRHLDRRSTRTGCSRRPRTSLEPGRGRGRGAPSLLALPGGLAGGAPPRPGRDAARAQHVHRQRAARDRGRAGPGHGHDPRRPPALPDARRC